MPASDAQLVDDGLEALKRYAARSATLTYGDLNRELGSPIASPSAGFPGRIGKLCDDINKHHEAVTGYGFMISALVHGVDSGLPGPGFFALAAELRRLPPTDDVLAKRVFVQWECEAAFAAYQQQ
ncbi:hypothetical protein AB0K52_13030 [Glycomyces sp. NPDC049804]|uniref:hypothetical protein n=1 Tax=Glycomyces sp. NPDC049804 TaxID=3154363 RepID=UPI003434BDC7